MHFVGTITNTPAQCNKLESKTRKEHKKAPTMSAFDFQIFRFSDFEFFRFSVFTFFRFLDFSPFLRHFDQFQLAVFFPVQHFDVAAHVSEDKHLTVAEFALFHCLFEIHRAQ